MSSSPLANLNNLSLEQIQRLLGPDAWRATSATMATTLSGGRWIPTKHQMWMSAKVCAAIAKGGARICISAPPRHGKSELFTRWTPPWALDRNARARVMILSYGAELVSDFGSDIRGIILENEARLNVKLAKNARGREKFLTTSGGSVIAAGIGGTIVGRGGDLILVDDYLKNAMEAFSPTLRQSIYNWFISTVMTRVEPNGNVILVATRWHRDDLIGRLRKYHSDSWTFISLPAVIENEAQMAADPLGRKMGEPLWPERYSRESLAQTRLDLGEYFWKALFQQEPIPEQGASIKPEMFHIADIIPPSHALRLIRYWDMAGTSAGGDYTVGTLLGADDNGNQDFVADVIRKQVSQHSLEVLLLQTAQNDPEHTVIYFEQEPGAGGKNWANYLKNDLLRNYKVVLVPSSGSKFVRAQPWFARIQARKVILKRAHWNQAFIDELCEFPDGGYDDQVDSSGGAYSALHSGKLQGVIWGRGGSGSGSGNARSHGAAEGAALESIRGFSLTGTQANSNGGATFGRSR